MMGICSNTSRIRDLLITDSNLHRLLMVEILTQYPMELVTNNQPTTSLLSKQSHINHFRSAQSDKASKSSKLKLSCEGSSDPSNFSNSVGDSTTKTLSRLETPDIITFNKMTAGINVLGNILIETFGHSTSEKITTLMHKRNEIIRDYYMILRSISQHTSVAPTTQIKHVITAHDTLIESYTNSTLRQLQSISHDIIDSMAAAFNLRNVQPTIQKVPIAGYQRLFNLLSMYDKELIHQAKAYHSHHYSISMNCNHSTFDIADNFSDELSHLITKQPSPSKR